MKQSIGQIETAIDRRTANTKTKRRTLLAQKQCDAWIENSLHRAINEEEKELPIKELKFNINIYTHI